MNLKFMSWCWMGCFVFVVDLRSDETIEVTSQGAVEVVPDMIWIEGRLSGSGDRTEAKKILDGLKSDIRKVVEAPQFADVKIEYSKRSVSTGASSAGDMQRQFMEMMGEGAAQADLDGMFTVAEDFRLIVAGLTEENFPAEAERMLELAVALTDKQIKLGQSANPMMPYYDGQSLGQFMRVGLSDPDRVWKTASSAAFDDARSKATNLAEIAGGKLGSAMSIAVEAHDSGTNELQAGLQELIVAQYSGRSSTARSGVSQSYLDRIPVKVTLRVRFAYTPAK
jgi:uncharacterized protein YggE